MTGKQHTAQNVGWPVITITTIRHSLQWHTLSSWTVKPLILFSLFFTSLLFASCSHSIVTPEDKPVLSVEPDEATCTQVWVKLKVSSPVSGYKYRLYRNGSMLGYFTTPPVDTVVLDEPLTPNYRCEYELIAEKDGTSPVSSGKRVITTLDTTSHNFTVQSYEFGNYALSLFRDVTITEDNNIWVAGEVYQTDTTGAHNTVPYNLFHWNGNTWEWKKINFYTFCPPTLDELPGPSSAVIKMNDGKILLAGYSKLVYYYGTLSPKKVCLDMAVYKFGIAKDNKIYAVGYQGAISQYNGVSWQPMQSGTSIDLYDIWGDTLGGEMWACGYTNNRSNTVLLHYKNSVWEKVYEGSGFNYNNNIEVTNFMGVWSNSKYFTYLTNYSFLLKQSSQGVLNLFKITPQSSNVIFAVRGTNHNNIFISGEGGMVGHFNGVTYKEISSLIDNDVIYYRIAVRGNTAVAVGQRYGGSASLKAVITVIKRN